MTDADRWWTETRPAALLFTAHERKARPPRKCRLFACGCYRLVWDHCRSPDLRRVVELSEQVADREVRPDVLQRHRYIRCDYDAESADAYLALSVQSFITPKLIPDYVGWLVRSAVEPALRTTWKWDAHPAQANLVRDIIRDPFRPLTFATSWRTEPAVALARTMYESRSFDRMPILADALEEAGCEVPEVLAHCRDSEGIHVRGCWVVDGVLVIG